MIRLIDYARTKQLLSADKHLILAANNIRQKLMSITAIRKEYKTEIKYYIKILRILSSNGYYLGEGLSNSKDILDSIEKTIKYFLLINKR